MTKRKVTKARPAHIVRFGKQIETVCMTVEGNIWTTPEGKVIDDRIAEYIDGWDDHKLLEYTNEIGGSPCPLSAIQNYRIEHYGKLRAAREREKKAPPPENERLDEIERRIREIYSWGEHRFDEVCRRLESLEAFFKVERK